MSLQGRLVAILCVLAAVLGLAGYIGHLRKEAADERVKAEAAEKKAELATATVQIVDHFHTTEKVITERAEAKADAVEQIPSDKLPDDLRRVWLDGLHDSSGAADDISAAKPARTVH